MIEMIVLVILVVLAIWDILFKELPSFLTTMCILLVLILRPENLIYGIMGFLFTYLLYEMFEGQYIGGWADIKVSAIVGLMITSLIQMSLFMVMIVVVGFFYVFILNYFLNIRYGKKTDVVPFIPVYLIAYIGVLLI